MANEIEENEKLVADSLSNTSHIWEQAVLLRREASKTSVTFHHPFLPNLCKYSPQNCQEADSQFFNIALVIPSRLKYDNDVAVWLLETETLNRLHVAIYLTSTHSGGSMTLQKLAVGLCSLPIGQSFVGGLKLFLPSSGCLLLKDDEHRRRKLLHAYSCAHLECSEIPILNPNIENAALATDLAIHLLCLYFAIRQGDKSFTEAMTEFFAAARTISDRNRQMSMKLLMDTFNDMMSGRQVCALPMPPNIPPYLFTSICKQGWVACALSSADERTRHWGVVVSNAIYLFEDEFRYPDCASDVPTANSTGPGASIPLAGGGAGATGGGGGESAGLSSSSMSWYGDGAAALRARLPRMCIPLADARVTMGDDPSCGALLIELRPVRGRGIPVLHFALPGPDLDTQADLTEAWAAFGVRRVTFHPCAVLEVLEATASALETEDWFDTIEVNAWACVGDELVVALGDSETQNVEETQDRVQESDHAQGQEQMAGGQQQQQQQQQQEKGEQ